MSKYLFALKFPFPLFFLRVVRCDVIMSSLHTRDMSSMMNGKHVFDQLAAQQKFNPVSSNLYSLSLVSHFFLVIRVISSVPMIKFTHDLLFAICIRVQGHRNC